MEIKNIQTITLGKGKEVEEMFFTLDLIPIQLLIRYDLEEIRGDLWGKKNQILCYAEPEYIKRLYNLQVYQKVIDLICEHLGLEKREVMCKQSYTPDKFNFKTDEYFDEVHHVAGFNHTYYVKSKLQNALKMWEQFEVIVNAFRDNKYNDEQHKMWRQYEFVYENIKKQGIFTNRDWHQITNATMDKFLKNINHKIKTK